jgi:CDGSH-type Zn-finger protein
MEKITITKDGPYLVSGSLSLKKEIILRDGSGFSSEYKDGEKYPAKETYALCRCGMSKTKPYCDGSHERTLFEGKETADKRPYLAQADRIEGPNIDLTDEGDLCFGAGFCHHKKGDVWGLTQKSDNKECKEQAVRMACNCPSGRLVVWDKKTGKPIEPEFKQTISLIEEPDKGVSGPIWAKGGVPIVSSDGKQYETRNRVCLCRCGSSRNKPFCDGSHVSEGFKDD